jgi:phosphonate transport system substrate-binding protein
LADAPTTPARSSPRIGLSIFVAVVVVAIIASLVYLAVIRAPIQRDEAMYEHAVLQVSGLNHPVTNKLSADFVDANQDGVADAPTDPAKQIDPPTLTFSFVATDAPETYREVFKDFTAHLSKQIGRPVEYVMFTSTDDELRAMRDGKLAVAGLSTGTVRTAVNLAGFVPLASLSPSEHDRFIHTSIIVPADSNLRTLSDLKGQTLALTDTNSNSGFKAPVVALKEDHGLDPGRDYRLVFSGGHEQSIRHIADKTYAAAAVASDVLDRAVAHHEIKADQFRVLFESAGYPAATFGCVYNLKPDLADKIKQAMLSFKFDGTSMEKEFSPMKETRLVSMDYAKDFESVRRIEDATGTVEAISTTPTTAPSTQQAVADDQK